MLPLHQLGRQNAEHTIKNDEIADCTSKKDKNADYNKKESKNANYINMIDAT